MVLTFVCCWWKIQAFIILSCLIAVSVNFSTFLVIGKTSPVTYQVLGHLKTCLVLGFGYTLLHDPFTGRNILGILVAVFGMGLYSYFCTEDNKKKQLASDLPLASQVLNYFKIQKILIFTIINIRSIKLLFRVFCLFTFYSLQVKDKDSAAILAGKNVGNQKEENDEVKKLSKDSVIWKNRVHVFFKFGIFWVSSISCREVVMSVNQICLISFLYL